MGLIPWSLYQNGADEGSVDIQNKCNIPLLKHNYLVCFGLIFMKFFCVIRKINTKFRSFFVHFFNCEPQQELFKISCNFFDKYYFSIQSNSVLIIYL